MITRLGFASASVMNAPEQHSNKADTRANATVSIFILDLLCPALPPIRRAYAYGIIWQ